MHRVRPPNRLRTRFRQADVAHGPRGHKLGHRAHRVLDRDRRVHPVKRVHVDVVDLEPAEAVGERRPEIIRRAPPHLGREHDAVPPAAQGAPDKLLVVAVGPIALRGVDQGDADLDRVMNRRDRLRLIGRAVGAGHRHRPEGDRRHARPGCAELPIFHETPPPSRCPALSRSVRARGVPAARVRRPAAARSRTARARPRISGGRARSRPRRAQCRIRGPAAPDTVRR